MKRTKLALLSVLAALCFPHAARAADAVPSAPPEPAPPALTSPPEEPAQQTGSGLAAKPVDKAGYAYSYAVQDTRFNDFISSSDAYKPLGNPASRFRPFVDLFYARDSRTSSGNSFAGRAPVPLIYSDNYGLVAAGVQYTTPQGLRAFAQGGKSFTIGPVAAQPSGGDFRGGVQLYREWGKTYAPSANYGNFYGSITYLSRYSDALLYSQLELVHNGGGGQRPIEPFVRVVMTLDSKTFYYSNTLEIVPGLRLHPFGKSGPIISIEGGAGRYLRGILPAGTNRTYADFRPTVSYGFSL